MKRKEVCQGANPTLLGSSQPSWVVRLLGFSGVFNSLNVQLLAGDLRTARMVPQISGCFPPQIVRGLEEQLGKELHGFDR